MSLININIKNAHRVALVLWGIGLLTLVVLSLLPPGNEPDFAGFVNDKIRHFTAYSLLALIAGHAGHDWRQRITLCVISFMISVLVEFLQPFTGRDFELMDIVANLSGNLAGMGMMILLLHWRSHKIRS